MWRGTLSSRDVCFFARSFRFGNAKAECSHSCNQDRPCCSIADADDEPMATVAALYNRLCYNSPCSLAHAVAVLQNRSCYSTEFEEEFLANTVARLVLESSYSIRLEEDVERAAVARLVLMLKAFSAAACSKAFVYRRISSPEAPSSRRNCFQLPATVFAISCACCRATSGFTSKNSHASSAVSRDASNDPP